MRTMFMGTFVAVVMAGAVLPQGAPGQIASDGLTAERGGTKVYLTDVGQFRVETSRGWFIVAGNEATIASKSGEDGSKWRCTAPAGGTCGVSFNENHILDPMDQHELSLIKGSRPDDVARANPTGGQLITSVEARGQSGDAGMRKAIVVSPAYSDDGLPRVLTYPLLGRFAEGAPPFVPPPVIGPPPPPVTTAPTPYACALALTPGDFGGLEQCYHFASGDYDSYVAHRMSWDEVIAEMVRRARPQ